MQTGKGMEINIHIAQLTVDKDSAALAGEELRHNLEREATTELTNLLRSDRAPLSNSPSGHLERISPGPERTAESGDNSQNLGQQLVHTILGGLKR